MLKLFCDLCDRKIEPIKSFIKDPILVLDIEETKYIGHNEFFVDTDCIKTTKYLCQKCRTRFIEFIHLENKEVDFNAN